MVEPDYRVAMYRLLGEADGEEPGAVLAFGGGYGFRTQDYGETWEAVVDSASESRPVNLYPFDPAERHPRYPEVLWTGFQTNTFQAIITRSGDNARTWANTYTCPPVCADSFPADFGFDAGDERVAYVALGGRERC